jgi:hypothetical protein
MRIHGEQLQECIELNVKTFVRPGHAATRKFTFFHFFHFYSFFHELLRGSLRTHGRSEVKMVLATR